MANIDTLISISGLLPEAQRERFLAMAASFQSVPEDDEYLQILEAISFMTLLWKEVPGEVQKILEGANPVTETCHSVGEKVREAVIEAIPSYDDLKRISQRLESHELALKNTLSRNVPQPTLHPLLKLGGSLMILAIGVVIGFVLRNSNSLEPWLDF
ncbi:MAG: hypothetical protein ACJAQT_000081 [Akkermansiaceae bacterium]|jgi:hypothetical protein